MNYRFGKTLGVAAGIVFSLTVLQAPASAASSVDVATRVQLLEDGQAAVTVTAVCPTGRTAFVEIQLQQVKGRYEAWGNAYTSVTCTGTPQEVTSTVIPYTGVLSVGKAVANARIWSCSQSDCEESHAASMVRIAR